MMGETVKGKAAATVSREPAAPKEEPLIENDMAKRIFQQFRRTNKADEAVAAGAIFQKGLKETAAAAQTRLMELLEDARSGQRHLFDTASEDEPEGTAGSEPPLEPAVGHEEDPVTPEEAQALADRLRADDGGQMPIGAAAVAQRAFVELGIRNLDELLAALHHEEPWLAITGMGQATLARLCEAAVRLENVTA